MINDWISDGGIMNKPKPKKEVAIKWTKSKLIVFTATQDAANDLKEFGKLQYFEDSQDYWLAVDPRFDFDEVIQYIEEYG